MKFKSGFIHFHSRKSIVIIIIVVVIIIIFVIIIITITTVIFVVHKANDNKHYSDVIMSATRLKSPASPLFAQPFVQAQIKTSKIRVAGLCERNPPVTDGFPSQRPVTRKMFPFDGIIMNEDDDDAYVHTVSKDTVHKMRIKDA